MLPTPIFLGFPGGSAGKESACNVGELGWIPGLGRSWRRKRLSTPVFWPGEFHRLQSMGLQSRTRLSDFHFTTSLVAQTVESACSAGDLGSTWVQSLGPEDLLEKGMATHFSIFAWRIPQTKETDRLHGPWGHKESDTTEPLHFTCLTVELQEYRGDADVLLEAYCERDMR